MYCKLFCGGGRFVQTQQTPLDLLLICLQNANYVTGLQWANGEYSKHCGYGGGEILFHRQ